MNSTDRVWGQNWRREIRSRLEIIGCKTVTEFLARFPGESYMAAAERLGKDVAALQLEWLHFDEGSGAIRELAMDSLARDLRAHLPGGWRHGAKDDFDTAGSYADWVVRLQQLQTEIKPKVDAVWAALEGLTPPLGWLPSGPNDPLIIEAFFKGWPES